MEGSGVLLQFNDKGIVHLQKMLQVCECSKALNCFATPPGGLF